MLKAESEARAMDAFLQSPWAPLMLTVVVWGVVQLIKALLDRK